MKGFTAEGYEKKSWLHYNCTPSLPPLPPASPCSIHLLVPQRLKWEPAPPTPVQFGGIAQLTEKCGDREELVWGSHLSLLSQGGLEPQERLTPTPLHHTHARVHTHPLSLIFSFSLPLRIVLMDDAMDCLMSFSDFLFAFQIQFYYSGESLPGPRGSCGTTVPHSPSRPVAPPPASLARTFCAASLHDGLPRRMCRSRRWSQDPPHDTESHGASRQRGDTHQFK